MEQQDIRENKPIQIIRSINHIPPLMSPLGRRDRSERKAYSPAFRLEEGARGANVLVSDGGP